MMDDAVESAGPARPDEKHCLVKAFGEDPSPTMLGVATIPAHHDPKPYAPARTRQVRNFASIPTVNASRKRSTQRTTRHLDTGPSGYKDGILELGHAFNNQTHGDESRNPKIDWHGADSFWTTARLPSVNFIEIESDPKLEAV
jgi:hypothetical protein